MGLVICVQSSDALTTSNVKDQVPEVCKHVIPHEGQWLLIPQPGKLMDLLRILKKKGIAYHFREFAFEG